MMMPTCTSRSAAMANAAMKMPIAESGATIPVLSCESTRVIPDRSESAVQLERAVSAAASYDRTAVGRKRRSAGSSDIGWLLIVFALGPSMSTAHPEFVSAAHPCVRLRHWAGAEVDPVSRQQRRPGTPCGFGRPLRDPAPGQR